MRKISQHGAELLLLRTARLTNPCFWLSAVSYRLSARKDRVVACAGINKWGNNAEGTQAFSRDPAPLLRVALGNGEPPLPPWGRPLPTLRTRANCLELSGLLPRGVSLGGKRQERWQSGRMRRFAKSVTGVTWSAGSNPVLSAPISPAAHHLRCRAFFVASLATTATHADIPRPGHRRSMRRIGCRRPSRRGPRSGSDRAVQRP